jgi:hypothetical protein
MSMKNSNDSIENRTRYLAACNAVPHPTAPPPVRSSVLRLEDPTQHYNTPISHNALFPSVRCFKLFQLLRKIYSLIFPQIPLPLIAEGLGSLLACVNIYTV